MKKTLCIVMGLIIFLVTEQTLSKYYVIHEGHIYSRPEWKHHCLVELEKQEIEKAKSLGMTLREYKNYKEKYYHNGYPLDSLIKKDTVFVY